MKKCQPVTLTPYLDGELNDDMRREIDQHLQSCASCGTLLEQLSDANRQVGSMGRAVIPVAALRPALDIFIERAGLTPGLAMAHATEVVRPGPVVEALEPEADLVSVRHNDSTTEIVSETRADEEKSPDQDDGLRDAWSAGLPAMAPPAATGIPDEEFWGEKSAHTAKPADLKPEPPAEAGEAQAPTWVEPEPWVPASHREELLAAEAPGVAASEADDGRVDSELSATGAEAVDAAPAVDKLELPGVEPKTAAPADRHEALEDHPTPPPPEIRPPWMEASPGDDEELEEAGRRAVDEAIGPNHEDPEASRVASVPAATDAPEDEIDDHQEPPRSWLASLFDNRREEPPIPEGDDTPAPEEEAPDERIVAAATAELAIAGPAAPDATEPATVEAPDDADQDRGYRRGLAWAQDEQAPPAPGLGSLSTQLKIGLLGGLGIVIVLVALLLITQGPATSPASTSAQHGAAHPSAAATPTRTAAPSPVPSATSTAPTTAQLSEVVTAGAGGSGWRVVGVRTGSPGSGITRVVFDLEGPGAQPDAQLGRGSDGGVYLTAPGITIAPETVAGFSGRDAITGITQTGTTGLALRLATNGSPGFSIGYLSVPNRLVLDFK
jgi:hypothetical protein